MIARTSVRWRLVAWVTGVLLAVSAVIFAVVYEQTGRELRAEVDQDVAGDVAQLSQAVKSVRASSPEALLAQMGAYLRGQHLNAGSSLLFASIPGHGSTSNPPQLLGSPVPDDGETAAEQADENAMARTLLVAPTRITTQRAPDIGDVRIDERLVRVGSFDVRVGAGEPLAIVTRRAAQHRAVVRHRGRAGARAGADRLLPRRRVGLAAAATARPGGGARGRRRPGPAHGHVAAGGRGDPGPGRRLQPHARSPRGARSRPSATSSPTPPMSCARR